MSNSQAPVEEVPTDIRITDNVIKRMVVAEQRRIGDTSPTKTAGRIIERYFAMIGSASEQPAQQPATSAA